MSIFKRNFFIASIIYVLFYLGPILINPFAILNLAEAFVIGVLVYGGFYLAYIFLYTNKSKLDERTKNTILTVIIMLIALFVYYNPISFPKSFNVIINNYVAIILLVAILAALIFLAKSSRSMIALTLLFVPSVIQGILMRVSYKAMIFYVNNPNFTLYFIFVIFLGYYIYNRRK